MDRMAEVSLVVLAVLGFVGWLGGGRKWAFRTLLSALVLVGIGAAGIFLYAYVTDKVAEHRTQRIHDCAVAKVATGRCVPGQPSKHPDAIIPDVCPPYMLFDNPTPELENAAISAAEEECTGELDPKQKSLHEQISQYRHDHGIQEEVSKAQSGDKPKGDVFDQLAAESSAKKRRLSSKGCADRVRLSYPGVYDDLDDATLTKKVLAKYPTYCDVTSSVPAFVPDIQGIR
jgi:hypothetical protein